MAAAPPPPREVVLLDSYLGADDGSPARAVPTPRGATSVRRRRWLIAGAGIPIVAAAVAVAAATAPLTAARAKRIDVLPDGPPLPTLGLPPMPPIAVTLADGRILRIDPTGTVAPVELGALAGSLGGLTPGSVELSATTSELYAGPSTGPGPIVAFGGGWHGGLVATGHSPAISNDGRTAWIDDAGTSDSIAVSRDGVVQHLVIATGAGHPPVELQSLSWSPTGARLAVEADAGDGSRAITILDLSGDDGVVSIHQIATARAPRWIADGTVDVVDASGTSVRTIDPDSGASVARPIDGAPAVAVDTDSRGDLLVVHDDGALTVGGRRLLSTVVAAVWQQ